MCLILKYLLYEPLLSIYSHFSSPTPSRDIFSVHRTKPGVSLHHTKPENQLGLGQAELDSASPSTTLWLCIFHQSTYDNGLACLKNVSWPGRPAFNITDLWPKTCTLSFFASVSLVPSSGPRISSLMMTCLDLSLRISSSNKHTALLHLILSFVWRGSHYIGKVTVPGRQ